MRVGEGYGVAAREYVSMLRGWEESARVINLEAGEAQITYLWCLRVTCREGLAVC